MASVVSSNIGANTRLTHSLSVGGLSQEASDSLPMQTQSSAFPRAQNDGSSQLVQSNNDRQQGNQQQLNFSSGTSFSSPYTSTTGYSRPISGMYSPSSSYGSNGYFNSFSSSYNNYGMMGQQPMMMNGPGGMPGQQQMETSFRHEYQGVLQGLNSLLHILYAGVGMITYGPKFVGFILNAFKSVLRVSFKLLAKTFGLTFIGKVFSFLRLGKGLEIIGVAFERAWRDSNRPNTSMSRTLVYARIFLGLGLVILFFINRTLNNQIREQEERRRQDIIRRSLNMHEIDEEHYEGLSDTDSLDSKENEENPNSEVEEAAKKESNQEEKEKSMKGEEEEEEEEKLNSAFKEASSEKQRNSHQEIRSEEFWTPKALSQTPGNDHLIKSVLNQNFLEQPEVIQKVEESPKLLQESEISNVSEPIRAPSENSEVKIEEVVKKAAVDRAKPWLSKSFSKN